MAKTGKTSSPVVRKADAGLDRVVIEPAQPMEHLDKLYSSHEPSNLFQPSAGPLHARLRMEYEYYAVVKTTRLMGREHFGPLRVQKALYPEDDDEVCHTIIVHPPAGVVGGDRLDISARVADSAHALITNPGASKWYKSNGKTSRQDLNINVGENASLEWMPQETIFYDNARVHLENTVVVGKGSSYISCEILCFGRTASGESYTDGKISQHSTIRLDGKLVWFEQVGGLLGGGPDMTSPLALSGKTVCATFIVVGKAVPAELIALVREEVAVITGGSGHFGVSQLKSVVVARYLGDKSEMARHVMLNVWRHIRPVVIGRKAVTLRMWET